MTKGMTKVSVLYPNIEGEPFDMDYYINTHIPLLEKLLKETIKGTSVEKGLSGAAPGSSAPYITIGVMYFDTVNDFNKAFGPNANQILEDIPNFTNIEPIVHISEIVA